LSRSNIIYYILLILQTYQIKFKDFKNELDKLINEDIKTHLHRKFKNMLPKEKLDDDFSWNNILGEWYKLHNTDPWLKVMSVLDTYEHHSAEDVVKQIKEKHLHLCHH